MARRQRSRRNAFKNLPLAEGEVLSLTQLERFSELSLRQWRSSAKNLTDLQTALFFGLELERQRNSQALIDAVRTNLVAGQPFERWARIVDYRYSSEPLSAAGSVKREGARFNPAFPRAIHRGELSHRLHRALRFRPNLQHSWFGAGGACTAFAGLIHARILARSNRVGNGCARNSIAPADGDGASPLRAARSSPTSRAPT